MKHITDWGEGYTRRGTWKQERGTDVTKNHLHRKQKPTHKQGD